jgi:hypothetical protein
MLSSTITSTLHDDNLWWRGERLFGLPSLRCWAFDAVLSGVQRSLTPATVLRGPRQVGKTTLLNQVIDSLLAQGVAGRRIFRAQFDELPALRNVTEPILELARWYPATVALGERRRYSQNLLLKGFYLRVFTPRLLQRSAPAMDAFNGPINVHGC